MRRSKVFKVRVRGEFKVRVRKVRHGGGSCDQGNPVVDRAGLVRCEASSEADLRMLEEQLTFELEVFHPASRRTVGRLLVLLKTCL